MDLARTMSSSLLLAAQVVVVSCLALLFLSVIQKARVLSKGLADEHVELARAAFVPARLAGFALVAAGLAEAVLLLSFLIVPTVALGAFAVLMLGYAAILARVPANASCACLGEALDISSRIAIGRNLVLAACAVAAAVIGWQDDLANSLFSGAVLGWSLVGLALLFGSLHSLHIVGSPAPARDGG
jgi:Methylamine utilisation protein MauE